MENKTHLADCPFCGEKDSICHMYAAGNQKHFIRCLMCRTDTAEFATEAEAITAWNRRTSAHSPAVRALVEEAAVLLDDCLIRIYPGEFSQSNIESAGERFGSSGGTISRIAHMVERLRAIAAVQREQESKGAK